MSVVDDKYWADTADFVRRHRCRPDRVIAPAQFRYLLPGALAYEERHPCSMPDAIVLHKGMLNKVGRHWIERFTAGLHASFANEVFVVFTKADLRSSVAQSIDFAAYLERLQCLPLPQEDTLAAAMSDSRIAVYVGDYLALTTTIFSHKMYVDTRDLGLAPHILLDGCWERSVTDVFLSLVRPGMRVVEIGANVGWYSLLAAEIVGSAGKLVSFEPNPRMADILMRNLSINGFVDRCQVIDKAVFSATRKVEFGIYEKYAAGSGLFAARAQAAREQRPAAGLHPRFIDVLQLMEVDAVALDSHFAPGSKVHIMKIDAEGAEPHIIAGANRLLEENRDMQIILEFAPRLLRLGGSSAEEFYDTIRTLGFRIFRIEQDASLQESGPSELMEGAGHHDVVLRR